MSNIKRKRKKASEGCLSNQQLIEFLQADLENERKHLFFYLQSSVMVAGLHREELKEFLLEEAKSELEHVQEFSELIVQLGGIPEMHVAYSPNTLSSPEEILKYAAEMEQNVADIYASRLRSTHEMENATIATVHVFYEDQIFDSQKAAWDIRRMIDANRT